MNPVMKDAQKQQDLLLKNSIEQSIGTGIYQTNTVKTSTRPVYPWAPTVRIQKRGASLVDDASLIDVDSELILLEDRFHHSKILNGKISSFLNFETGYYFIKKIY